MQLDKQSLNRLIALNDDQLRMVLKGLIREYGIDPQAIPLEQFDMSKLREALAGATEADVQKFAAMLSGGDMGGRR
ncbi:MAG: hypothetical protein E7645_04215 [Ruminococcaceae bacterium]|nr:hypothetical protein [Oscillospiraceae bacterium]